MERTPVIVADEQYDPVKDTLIHIDLKRIDLTRKLRVSIPIHTIGEPKGVKQQGGVLDVVTRSVEIECIPDDIPNQFDVDVTELMIGSNYPRFGTAGIRRRAHSDRARSRDRSRRRYQGRGRGRSR